MCRRLTGRLTRSNRCAQPGFSTVTRAGIIFRASLTGETARLLTMFSCLAVVPVAILGLLNPAGPGAQGGVRAHYRKFEYRIAVRDGVKLYANVYVPTDKPGKHPIILERTP